MVFVTPSQSAVCLTQNDQPLPAAGWNSRLPGDKCLLDPCRVPWCAAVTPAPRPLPASSEASRQTWAVQDWPASWKWTWRRTGCPEAAVGHARVDPDTQVPCPVAEGIPAKWRAPIPQAQPAECGCRSCGLHLLFPNFLFGVRTSLQKSCKNKNGRIPFTWICLLAFCPISFIMCSLCTCMCVHVCMYVYPGVCASVLYMYVIRRAGVCKCTVCAC